MSEPDRAENGRSMGDNIVGNSLDITEDDAVGFRAAAGTCPAARFYPAARVRLATVAARYNWNRALTLPK